MKAQAIKQEMYSVESKCLKNIILHFRLIYLLST